MEGCRASHLVGVVGGGAAWTIAEYGTHRIAMHRWRSGPIASEHRAHHRDPAATSPWLRTAGVLAVAAGAQAAATMVSQVVGAATVWRSAALGFGLGYAAYDQLHWRVHHRAPLGAWERRRRPRHLDHHVNPSRNFGVTTSFWDRVAGTFVEPDIVRLPAGFAPSWMLDDGAIDTRYAGRFSLR